jgi:hypothetical protein
VLEHDPHHILIILSPSHVPLSRQEQIRFYWLDLALATSASDAPLAKLPISNFQNPKLCVFKLVWVFPSTI